MLTDLGNILSIELGASGGTYVADNPSLCIEAPSVTWAQRSDSYISYNATQCVSGNLCPLFSDGGYCVSSCGTCGTLCNAFPITDMSSLELYKTKGCTVISGDLYIMGLASSISKGTLLANLQGITRINGVLYLLNNAFLTSLLFFENVVELYGGVYLNNPNLVDTRLPTLSTLHTAVVVDGCDRLCPARYTSAGAVTDESGCSNLEEDFFYDIQGSITIADLALFEAVITRVMKNISSGQV